MKSSFIIFVIVLAQIVAVAQCDYDVSIDVVDASCVPGGDGAIALSVSGNKSPVWYVWSDGGNEETKVNLSTGDYFVTATDGVCMEAHVINVTNDVIRDIYYTVKSPSCGTNDGYVQIDSIDGGRPTYAFSWDKIVYTTEMKIDSLNAGDRRLYIQDGGGCEFQRVISIPGPIFPKLNYLVTPRKCNSSGKLELLLTIDGVEPIQYVIDSDTSTTPFFVEDDLAQKHTISVVDGNNCVTTKTVQVPSECELTDFARPNPAKAFSPNGDGKNDTWTIQGINDFPHASITVYDRWGQEVFSDNQRYTEPWDGTKLGLELAAATYYYVIMLNQADSNGAILTGAVAIIR